MCRHMWAITYCRPVPGCMARDTSHPVSTAHGKGDEYTLCCGTLCTPVHIASAAQLNVALQGAANADAEPSTTHSDSGHRSCVFRAQATLPTNDSQMAAQHAIELRVHSALPL